TALFHELGVERPEVPQLSKAQAQALPPDASAAQRGDRASEDLARTLAKISIIDIGAFFAVLLVGFAYVWKRGDLDWVRALSKQRALQQEPRPRIAEDDHVLSA